MRCWRGYLPGARCRLFAYRPADATASQTPSSLGLFKSRLILLFWYRLTQVVPEKRLLNGCSVVVAYTDTGCAGQLRNRRRVLDSVQCCEWVIASVCCYECVCVHVNHRGSTSNETWSHRYRRSARWPLENNLNFYLFYAYNRKESVDEGFTYSNLAILCRSHGHSSCQTTRQWRHWWLPTWHPALS